MGEKSPRNSNNTSHVLGPIKRPLTASNKPKHGKTLKNWNKTQVGRKSYLKEFEETPKSEVHALFSPRRTISLLAPSTADGRIAQDSREKLLLLSLTSKKSATAPENSFLSRFVSHLTFGEDNYSLFCHLVT